MSQQFSANEVSPGVWEDTEPQPLNARYCGIEGKHEPHRFIAAGYMLACAGESAPAKEGRPAEYVVRLSYQEASKIAYLARKHSSTQNKRHRMGDVKLLDGIEEKMHRITLAV